MLRAETKSTWKCTSAVVVKIVIIKAKTAWLKEKLQLLEGLGELTLHFVDGYTFKIVNAISAKDIALGMLYLRSLCFKITVRVN